MQVKYSCVTVKIKIRKTVQFDEKDTNKWITIKKFMKS